VLKILVFAAFALGLLSCSNDSTTQPDGLLLVRVAERPATRQAAITSPEKTVRAFLAWYANHQATLPTDFVDHTNGQDTTKGYAVNVEGTEKWLAEVRRSDVVSAAYLQHWRTYFRQYADTLRLHKQYDGPPAGFDYDFLMLSQEPAQKVDELRAGTFVTQLTTARQATVTVLGPQHDGWREGMKFKLSQASSGEWLIDEMRIPDNLTQ